MANYQEARVKLTNTQLNKLKSAAENKTGTILGLNKKNIEELKNRHMMKIRHIKNCHMMKMKNCHMNYF